MIRNENPIDLISYFYFFLLKLLNQLKLKPLNKKKRTVFNIKYNDIMYFFLSYRYFF